MRDGKMKKAAGDKRHRVAVMVATAILVPAFAFAVETDRVTVEDPATGAVMFRVTSGGNVTGTSFNGDGSALTNVPHWKGAWSGVATYNKDEVVSYSGSSYIALKQSVGSQPNLDASSWAVLAQQGATGASGPEGPAGAVGPIGPIGPAGPAGASDTQTQILEKLSAPVMNTPLVLQAGATEPATSPKILIKDGTGTAKFVVQPNGALGIGTGQATFPVLVDSSIGATVPAGVGTVMISGNSNKERIELRSYGPTANCAIQGKTYRTVNGLPAATAANQTLFSVGGSGHDGNDLVISNKIFMDFRAAEAWTPTAQGTYFVLHTTTPGTTTRTEKFRVNGDGNIGVGSSAPTQKLEVNGGIRINTAAVKPACSSSARGTFWYTQGDPNDALEVCALQNGSYQWKALW